MWFENRYSLQYKMDLAEEFRLGGLALFNLGQEDDQIGNGFRLLIGEKFCHGHALVPHIG